MTTLKEHLEILNSEMGDKLFTYTIIGSLFNMLKEGIDELEDEEITKRVEQIQKLINNKLIEICKTELEV